MKGVQSITTCLYVVGPRRQLQETEQIWKQNTLKSAAKRLKDHPVCRGKDTASEAHCSLLESTIEQTILESTIEQTKQGVPRAGNSQLHTPCNRQGMLDARIPNDRCFSPPCDENVAKKKTAQKGPLHKRKAASKLDCAPHIADRTIGKQCSPLVGTQTQTSASWALWHYSNIWPCQKKRTANSICHVCQSASSSGMSSFSRISSNSASANL